MKQFDGYNDLHNTYSVKHHVPAYKGKFAYKGRYENQLSVNKGLLIALGLTVVTSLLIVVGTTLRFRAETSQLQGQYDIAWKYMLDYEKESNYYKTELATVSAELQMSKLSYKAKQDMKLHPLVVEKIKEHFKSEWTIAVELYSRESSLNPGAVNKSSGACGLPQALPCSKMACSLDDVDCQLAWGLSYINQRYGTPQAALNHSYMTGWY